MNIDRYLEDENDGLWRSDGGSVPCLCFLQKNILSDNLIQAHIILEASGGNVPRRFDIKEAFPSRKPEIGFL